MAEENEKTGELPKKLSLFRLVIDQARIDDDVRNYDYDGCGTQDDPYVVTFIPGDAGNPFNWSTKLRSVISMIVAMQCFATAFSSSAFSGTLRELIVHFRVNITLMTGGISLFVLGFAIGPLLWAPLSEFFGRQYVFIATFACATIFSAACTADGDITTLLVMRFLAGTFGSSPFTNAGGVIADIFPASQRGLAMVFFALAPSMGPTFGPFIAGFLGENEGWRWVMGLMAIFMGFMFILGSLVVPETYAPTILRKRAKVLSKMTGKVYKAQADIEKGDIALGKVLRIALVRPWILLFREPIVLILSIYLAVVYGTLYLLFGAFPVVFQLGRGWSEGISGLAFLGVAVGMFIAIIFQGWANKFYVKAANDNGGIAPPEARLPPTMVGAVAIPVGLIWFAWTNSPTMHWMIPIAAGVPFGFGLTLIFLGVINYLIDAYTIFAASVLAANAVLRSLFGAAFPLFTRDMYKNLGIHWASMVPAFLALACLPAPFILYKYGAAIRARCAYAIEAEKALLSLRTKAARSQDVMDIDVASQVVNSTFESGEEHEDDESNDDTAKIQPLKTISRKRANSTATLQQVKSRTGTIAEAAAYDASPYDIDRVNTVDSIAGIRLKKTKTNISIPRSR